MTATTILCSHRRPSSGHRCYRPASYMDADGLMWCATHAADLCAQHVMTPMEATTVS